MYQIVKQIVLSNCSYPTFNAKRMTTKSFVAEILKREVEIPDKPAFIFLGNEAHRTVLTFSDVISLSQKFAARLRSLGITRGDVVCNTLPTSPERLITHLGTVMAGAIAMVGQIFRADGSDFLASLRDARANTIIYDSDCPTGTYTILKKAETDERHQCLKEGDKPRNLISCILKSSKERGTCLIQELENSLDKFCEDNGPESLCAYMCTSGTTGKFKLVPYTSKLLMHGSYEFAQSMGLNSNSVLFNDKPLGWTVGTPSIAFMLGCTRVIVDESVYRGQGYPRFVTEALRQENCTAAICTTVALENLFEQALLGEYEDRYLLKSMVVLGSPTFKKVIKTIGTLTERLIVLYGSTETYNLAKIDLTSKDQEYSDFLCGHPIAGVDVKVVDSNMKDVPVDHIGELLVRKPMACTAYVNNDKATQETFLPVGWIRLGDMGFLNGTGQITVLGRGFYAIKRGDDIIYPGQLEAPLLQCPGLADVLITGVPDEAQLEEVCALLVRHPGTGEEIDEDYVRTFYRESLSVIPNNPEYDPTPKYFFFVDAIPKLNTGKTDRVAARQMAVQLVLKDNK